MASHSPESLEALATGDKQALAVLVLQYVRRCREYGVTIDETCQALNLLPSSCAPRLTELRKAGLVRRLHDAKGQRVRRLTRQDCWASVLVAREFAPVETNPGTFPQFGDLTPAMESPRPYRDPEEG